MSQLACLPFFLTQALDAAMQGPAFHEFTDKVRQVGSHSMLPSIREHKQKLLLLSPSTIHMIYSDIKSVNHLSCKPTVCTPLLLQKVQVQRVPCVSAGTPALSIALTTFLMTSETQLQLLALMDSAPSPVSIGAPCPPSSALCLDGVNSG